MTVLMIVVGCLFVALLARLWFLQVVNVTVANQQVATTGIVTIYRPAPRGEILSRGGKVLVANRQIPVIEVQQQEASNSVLVARLSALLGVPVKTMKALIGSNQYLPYEPVPVFPNASPAQILYVQEHQPLFPGVTATTETEPYVTQAGLSAGNVVGYVGQIDSAELAALNKAGGHYLPGDIIGLTGAEAEFEKYLQGKPGIEKIQVNSQGQELGVISNTPPVPGDNVRLTISASLQSLAVLALHQGEAKARHMFDPVTNSNYMAPGGSALVENPANGQIAALATDPGFNPNLFDNGGISQVAYNALLNNPAHPLENRPIQGLYAPGSTFKLATATAGLLDGIITPTSTYNDTGSVTIGGRVFHDAGNVGGGVITLHTALAISSDNYFNVVGADLWDQRARLGPNALQNIADAYGLNKPTGIDLPGESAGVIPTPALFAAQYKQYPKLFASPNWYSGDSAITAIGQGEVEVTPIAMANAYSAFANGGTLYQPQIALDIETPSGKVIKTFAPVVKGHTPNLPAADRAAMLRGYIGAANNPLGTAGQDFIGSPLASLPVAGKTGTAQVTAPKQITSVFTGFAPAYSPKWVAVSFMEDAGYGTSVAAPIVRELLEKLFGTKVQPVSSYPPVNNLPY